MKITNARNASPPPEIPEWLPRRLMTPAEVAEVCGLSEHTLATWRCRRVEGPAYLRVGGRIMYDPADLWGWLSTRRRASTLAKI